MNHWWQAPEYAKGKAMNYPQRELGRPEVIVLRVKRDIGDKAQPANDRVRVYTR